MAENDFGLRELYDVKLKATYNMDIGPLSFKEGEVITEFDSIQIANFSEVRKITSADGGFDNRAHVIWETTREAKVYFSKGIFNKIQFAILQNAKLVTKSNNTIVLTQSENTESNSDKIVTLKYKPVGHICFRDEVGQYVQFEQKTDKTFLIGTPFKEIYASYDFEYTGKTDSYIIGQHTLKGFLALEARTRVKDDITGQTHTGILRVPKLQLTSDLSIKLGDNATPQVEYFHAVGLPTGSRGSSKVMELILLNDDIDSDF